jgi:hypothetical protein
MTKQTARELLDVIVNDIQQIDLEHYQAIYALGDIANRVARVIDVAGKEIFNESEAI